MGKKVFLVIMATALILMGCSDGNTVNNIKNSNTIVFETLDEKETISMDSNVKYADNVGNFYNLNNIMDIDSVLGMTDYGDGRILVAEVIGEDIEFNAYSVETWEYETIAVREDVHFWDSYYYADLDFFGTDPIAYTMYCDDGFYFEILSGESMISYGNAALYDVCETKYGIVLKAYSVDEVIYYDFRNIGDDGLPVARTINVWEDDENPEDTYRGWWFEDYNINTDEIYIGTYQELEGDMTYAFSLEKGTLRKVELEPDGLTYDSIYYGDGYDFSMTEYAGSGLYILRGDEAKFVEYDSYDSMYTIIANRFVITYDATSRIKNLSCLDTYTMGPIVEDELFIDGSIDGFIYLPELESFIIRIYTNDSTVYEFVLWDVNNSFANM